MRSDSSTWSVTGYGAGDKDLGLDPTADQDRGAKMEQNKAKNPPSLRIAGPTLEQKHNQRRLKQPCALIGLHCGVTIVGGNWKACTPVPKCTPLLAHAFTVVPVAPNILFRRRVEDSEGGSMKGSV